MQGAAHRWAGSPAGLLAGCSHRVDTRHTPMHGSTGGLQLHISNMRMTAALTLKALHTASTRKPCTCRSCCSPEGHLNRSEAVQPGGSTCSSGRPAQLPLWNMCFTPCSSLQFLNGILGLLRSHRAHTVLVGKPCTFRSCCPPAGPLLQTSKVVLRAAGSSKSSTHRAATSLRDTWPCSTGIV